ncbi:hypothetical protein HAX54_010568 [Datura stramonium]|uniref:Uncharacterized protein n=1 Tax=Datura stramonium TaxID=4076 RepID=A0ABS8WYP1_DATST|nr:hypothetical protein [Datura stramonium]
MGTPEDRMNNGGINGINNGVNFNRTSRNVHNSGLATGHGLDYNHPLFSSSSDVSGASVIEDDEAEINFNSGMVNNNSNNATVASIIFADFNKDGSSDSDSSAILNEDSSPNAAISSSGAFLISNNGEGGSSSSTSLNFCFQFTKSSPKLFRGDAQKANYYYQPLQYVKMEEHNFFNGEESCNEEERLKGKEEEDEGVLGFGEYTGSGAENWVSTDIREWVVDWVNEGVGHGKDYPIWNNTEDGHYSNG